MVTFQSMFSVLLFSFFFHAFSMACMARCHEKAKIKTNTKTNNRKKTKQQTQYEERQGASNQHLSKCQSYKAHGLTTTPLNPTRYSRWNIVYFNHLALDCLNKASSQASGAVKDRFQENKQVLTKTDGTWSHFITFEEHINTADKLEQNSLPRV